VETHFRSILKAVSYRIVGTIVTFCVAFVLSKNLDLAIKVGFLDTVLKIGAFYFHERLWHRIKLGKTEPIEYEI
jgi:adenylylsulfate kinase